MHSIQMNSAANVLPEGAEFPVSETIISTSESYHPERKIDTSFFMHSTGKMIYSMYEVIWPHWWRSAMARYPFRAQ
jgi:hypothetical protein